jgi:hypothetical protein
MLCTLLRLLQNTLSAFEGHDRTWHVLHGITGMPRMREYVSITVPSYATSPTRTHAKAAIARLPDTRTDPKTIFGSWLECHMAPS